MAYRIPYSVAEPGSFVHVPGSYVSQVARHVADIVELKVTLLVFHLLSQSRAYPGYVTHADAVLRAASLLGVEGPECELALNAAVARGAILMADLPPKLGGGTAYFANIEADIDAIERLKAGDASAGSSAATGSNVFQLYEQNIGVITPMIAEELRDAQVTYPLEWIEDAFREAVTGQKRNWKYIRRILERWRVEGRGSGTNRPGAVPDDPDKYVKGRYGRVVRR